nr:asparagine synthase (glutamine-hydrolyzing) [uncultured Dyadobacter sp.]
MCGIAGFIDYSRKSKLADLEVMNELLNHRGPDSSGLEVFNPEHANVGLGHKRLSIIEVSPLGHQPMFFDDLWITFNGEIFNFLAIKEELIALQHHFLSDSDTEVILHAYRQWGVACVDRFVGMFSFVLYDVRNREMICVRDRAGIKPFFYYSKNGLFLFSSELKSLCSHPGFKKEINLEAVGAFMQYGNVPTPHCIFNDTHKLKPGHFLKISIENQEMEIVKYWDVYDAYNKPKLDISFAEAKEETTRILRTAFNHRMVSDVPLGLFLSGGYDSTALTALLQDHSGRKLRTFTMGVPDIGLDESKFAKNISDHLGTDHTQFECTESDALEIISQLPYYYDEPFGDPSAIPTMLLCKLTREHVTVALSADGGDEVFAGYNRYEYVMKFGGTIKQIPAIFRVGLANLMDFLPAKNLAALKARSNYYHRYEKVKSFLRDPSPANVMQSLGRQYDQRQVNQLLIDGVDVLKTAHLSGALQQPYFSPLAYMMAIDYQSYLMDDVLQKVDRASMAFGLEAREPFVDHNIIEWVAQLPDSFKYNAGVKKHILKEIVHDYIPKPVMDRPKMGFAIPIESWLSTSLKSSVMYYLGDDHISRQGIFRLSFVRELKSEFYSGKKEYAFKIWYLLMFQMWYEKWMS